MDAASHFHSLEELIRALDNKIKTFRLHLKHDADILEYLDTKESVNRYLKDLIREDIERQKKEAE